MTTSLSVTDSHDDVNDGGELVKSEVLSSGGGGQVLPERARFCVVLTLYTVHTHALQHITNILTYIMMYNYNKHKHRSQNVK